MAKVLLVEDDNNLREIYQARLQAEGYDIVTARDGEEALVVAKQEQPQLVISDVMMPKISGFEMLDILRNTPGLDDVKVIMLTALGQTDDQIRANNLGADRYLVKSQVTLEDIVNSAKELLEGEAAALAPEEAAPAPEAPAPVAVVAEPVVTPVQQPVVAEPAIIPLATEPADYQTTPTDVVSEPIAPIADVPAPEPVQPAAPDPAPVPEPTTADPQSSEQEEAVVEQQIESFVASQPGTAPAQVTPNEDTPVAVEPETTQPTTTPEQEQALNDALTDLGGTESPADTPAAAPEAATTSDGLGEAGPRKVIVPITESAEPKKSLDELVAEEEAKQKSQQPPQAPQPTTNKGDFDPNSISL